MLTGDDAKMLDLLRAVAERDVTRVARLGSALFTGGYRFGEPAQAQLALIATAASYIATDRFGEALDLTRNEAPRTSYLPATGLAVRWLSAIAVERSDVEAGHLTRASIGRR